MKIAKENDKVKVHYKGKLVTGEVFDSSEGKDPIEFILGSGQVIPGFDKGVQGMKVNEQKTIEIPSSDAYGSVNPDLIQDIPKKNLPPDIAPEVGLKLVSKTPKGNEIPVVVTEVTDDTIKIDANHPLAGKDLVFEVELINIE